jgi:hypothetical protein
LFLLPHVGGGGPVSLTVRNEAMNARRLFRRLNLALLRFLLGLRRFRLRRLGFLEHSAN